MAIVRAVASGNWSAGATWNTGSVPTSADDVYSNTFTVTIDTSPTVLRVSNASATGVTAGGTFVPNNGITLTCTGAGVVGGFNGTSCITSSLTTGQSYNVIGFVSAGNAAGQTAISISSFATVNITGAVTGGGSGAAGVSNGTGTVNITGDVQGSSAVANAPGVSNASTGTVNITGTILAVNSSGYSSTTASTLTHSGTVTAANNAAAIFSNSTSAVVTVTGPFLTSANGTHAILCPNWRWASTQPVSYYQVRTVNTDVIRTLFTADSVAGVPAASNVRSGTVYGPSNELTGTCAVPGASSVLSGVPVDNTTGTATISAASIRSALGLASANLDTQLAAIPTTAAPTAAAIRTEMDSNSTKLANLDATVSSRSTYAGADTSGTTTLLGRLTSGRAAGLDNLDATISSRLPSSSYSAPLDAAGTRSAVGLASGNLDSQLSSISSGVSGLPSASAIATAVWAAATRTLTTAIDNSATIAAAVWGYATGRTITGGTVDSLTNAPSVPSAAQIASQVRTELSTELGRIDAPVTSRLEPSGTLARVTLVDTATTLTNAPSVPSPATVASAVRTELTPELARVANAATTQEVGDLIEEALQ